MKSIRLFLVASAISGLFALAPMPAQAGSINIVLPVPSVSVVFPPPPVVITPGPAAYWFWDDGRGVWFYYDSGRRRHYDRNHVFMDDGRHYYLRDRNWAVANHDEGMHRGWYKKENRRHKKEWREDRREERQDDRRDEHGHGHGHGHDDDDN
jgi:hypothetical protein